MGRRTPTTRSQKSKGGRPFEPGSNRLACYHVLSASRNELLQFAPILETCSSVAGLGPAADSKGGNRGAPYSRGLCQKKLKPGSDDSALVLARKGNEARTKPRKEMRSTDVLQRLLVAWIQIITVDRCLQQPLPRARYHPVKCLTCGPNFLGSGANRL